MKDFAEMIGAMLFGFAVLAAVILITIGLPIFLIAAAFKWVLA